MVREFINRFMQCNGSIKCKDILSYDISTIEGAKIANEKQLFTTLCPKFVEDAALIIEQILDIDLSFGAKNGEMG